MSDDYIRELIVKNSLRSASDCTDAEIAVKRIELTALRDKRLTNDDCEKIRNSGLSAREEAAYWDVHISTVYNIRSGRTRSTARELKEAA